MARENPDGWRAILDAVKLADANAETLALCAARARENGKAARCMINVQTLIVSPLQSRPSASFRPLTEMGRTTGSPFKVRKTTLIASAA